MLSPGTKLGPYQIRSAIGAGGMGEVYRAFDTRLDRVVAVKILPPQLTRSAAALERFQREAKAIAALSHPNICAIYDIGETPGGDGALTPSDETLHFLVMELLEGETLQSRLARGPLDLEQVINIGATLCEAVGAAHGKGILHRDIKPANIFLTAHGPKVLDFGLAKTVGGRPNSPPDSELPTYAQQSLTNTGIAVGTVAYMSPEQVRGEALDARSDVFSLGLVLYEMAAGRPAFSGATPLATAAAILHEQPTAPQQLRPDLPTALEAVILRALNKNPDWRTQSASTLSAEFKGLDRLRESIGSAATPAPFVSRHSIALIATAAAAVLLLAALYLIRQQLGVGAPTHGFKPTRLTISGNADRPAISPDGKLVVYVQHGDGDSLWVRQTNQSRTANDVQIVPAETGVQIFGATVTPDGTNVDYLRGTIIDILELWRTPILGGARKLLIEKVNTPVGWSPDGKQMAFLRWNLSPPATSLVLADVDGKNERIAVTREGGPEYPPFFSKNGQGMQRPSWSPDGTSIAIVGSRASRNREVVIVDVAQRRERIMRGDGSVRSLTWLDARTLLLTIPTGEAGLQLWQMSYPGGSLSRLSLDDLTPINGGFSVTSDGAEVVTSVRTPKVGLWIGDGQASKGKQYTAPQLGLGRGSPGGFSLTWVGNKLVYPVNGDRLTIVAVDPDSESVEELVGEASRPASSPDGRTIVYVANGPGANAGLWKADADGRHRVQLVSGNVNQPVVTADDRVIFGSNRNNQYSLWVVPLAGGPVRALVRGPATSPVLSPDGSQLMYGTADAQHPDGAIVVCDLPACSQSKNLSPALPTGASLVTWTPDGRGLAYANQSNIWVQPLDGGSAYRLTQFSDGPIGYFSWSHDGSRLAISRSLGTATDVILFKKF